MAAPAGHGNAEV